MSHIVKFQFLISSVDQLLIISPGHCMPLNSYKLHLVIYFYPISPTKIFMPVCIFRFYQYVESLTWGTLKQVIRVYCTIKSMTFFKDIFFRRQNIHQCDLVHGPQTFKNTQCVYILIFILSVNECFSYSDFLLKGKKKSTPVIFLWVIDLIVLTLGVCVRTQIILLNRLVHILHTCSTFTVYTEASNFSGLTIQVVTDV